MIRSPQCAGLPSISEISRQTTVTLVRNPRPQTPTCCTLLQKKKSNAVSKPKCKTTVSCCVNWMTAQNVTPRRHHRTALLRLPLCQIPSPMPPRKSQAKRKKPKRLANQATPVRFNAKRLPKLKPRQWPPLLRPQTTPILLRLTPSNLTPSSPNQTPQRHCLPPRLRHRSTQILPPRRAQHRHCPRLRHQHLSQTNLNASVPLSPSAAPLRMQRINTPQNPLVGQKTRAPHRTRTQM